MSDPAESGPRVSIAIPAYNEEVTVESVVCEAVAALEAVGGPYEVLVVDDGSVDRTGEILDRLTGTIPSLRVLHHERNRGFSGAMRTCLWEAAGELVYLAPADKQARLTEIARFLDLAPQYDFIFSYRIGRQDSPLRRAGTLFWYGYLRLLFGTAIPEFSSTFLFRREPLHTLSIDVADNASNMLPVLFLQARRAGFRVGQLGTVQYERAGGQAKGGNLRNALRTMVEDYRLWRRWRAATRPRPG